MATKVTESSLTCSICLRRFRKPRALPCLHSYCEECLVEYAPKGTQVLMCPLCQEKIQIPDGDVTKFKLDFRLQSQVEDATRYEKEAGIVPEIRMCTCCRPKDEDEAMATCRKCGQLLCKFGVKAHERLAVLGDHKVIPLSDGDSAQLDELINEMQGTDETTKVFPPEKRAILVSNIPDQKCSPERMRDRLAIHFLRKRNGGGDIDGILYPLEGCPQKAVIAFTDKEASDLVLQTDHVLEEFKAKVTVEPLPQVFNKVEADIDAFYWNLVPRLITTQLIDEFSKTHGKKNLQTAGHILKKITCTMSELDDVHSTIVRATGLPIARNSYSVIGRGMFVKNIPYLTDETEQLRIELKKHLQTEGVCQLENLTCPVKGNVNEAIALFVSSSERETYIGTSDKCFFGEVLQISRLPPVFRRMTAHLADFFINLVQHSGNQQFRVKLQASCGQDMVVTDRALTGNPEQLQKASTTILEIIGLCDANLIPTHLSETDLLKQIDDLQLEVKQLSKESKITEKRTVTIKEHKEPVTENKTFAAERNVEMGDMKNKAQVTEEQKRTNKRALHQRPQFPEEGGRISSRETRKVIARDSRGPEVTLKKAENPWKPGSKKEEKEKNISEEEVKTEELIKTFKSILNKLTPSNFKKLLAKTLQLPIDNEERLMAIVHLVHEKAITEPAFSKAYANMCRVLSQIKVPAANEPGFVQFRTVLINRCQRTFEASFAEMKKEIEILKVIGNTRFMGELLKLHMLTEPVVHDCIFKLLRAKDNKSLECVCQLMKTVGEVLDHERAKKRMDQYFDHIAKHIRNKKVPAKIRFMLQDVQDLRKSNWIPRKPLPGRYDINPKTIAQIHQEAKQDEQQKKLKLYRNASKSNEKSIRGRPGPPTPGNNWQTMTATNKGRPQIDPSKLINLGRNVKLEYTLQKIYRKTDPLALMVKELSFMLARKDKCDNVDVFGWIKKNIDPELTKQKDFIRALVAVVCQSTIESERSSIRCDPELLKVRAKCLLRYIDGDQDKELQALFAVQALNHQLVNPPGFLRLIFDVLYDEDVISEETFYAWQNSKDPAEQNGKSVALKSVTSFFAWIGEAEEEVPK